MTYRKLKAAYLFDGHKMAQPGAVLICSSEGTIETITDESSAGEGIEQFAGMLTPGFVNAHCHLELSHLRGLVPEKQGLVSFLLSVITQRNQEQELKDLAALAAETEMYANGIVAVGDICNTPDTLMIKSAGRLNYYNFIELLGWAPEQAPERLKAAATLAEQFKKQSADLLNNDSPRRSFFSISPHAPYSVSRQLWQLMEPGFTGRTVTIHNQESLAENEFFRKGSGDLTRLYSFLKMDISGFVPPETNSISWYLPHLRSAARILLVHNTYMEETDLMQADAFHEQVFFCFCPNANLYIENRLPDIPLFLKHHAKIVLGTDSLASNHQLNILEEIKTIMRSFAAITTSEILSWATFNGAQALQLEDRLGDFTQGKKPGILLIDSIKEGEITLASTVKRLI